MNAAGQPQFVPEAGSMSSDDLIEVIEGIFADYAGFRNSQALTRKIQKVVEGKDERELRLWLNYMMNQKSKSEIKALAEDLTNHETFFFRDEVQLDLLSNDILPELIKKKIKNHDRVIRIWCAACSTGEEAYSLAMIVVDYFINHKMARMTESGHLLMQDGWQIKIYGTDLSSQVVTIARNAVYIDSGLSPFRGAMRHYMQYFKDKGVTEDRLYKKASTAYEVMAAVRRLVHFDVHNLNDNDMPLFLKEMDVVFCRNVMIYFNEATQLKAQEKFSRSLVKDGYLILSAVDTLRDKKHFKEKTINRIKIFQRR